MKRKLGAFVAAGRTRATAGPTCEYAAERVALPVAGGHFVVVDGAGAALCMCRVPQMLVTPLSSVDDARAWAEGEGTARPLIGWPNM